MWGKGAGILWKYRITIKGNEFAKPPTGGLSLSGEWGLDDAAPHLTPRLFYWILVLAKCVLWALVSKSGSLITHDYPLTSSCGIKFVNRLETADFPHFSVRLKLHQITSRTVDYFIRRDHQIFWSFWSQPCCLGLKSTLMCCWLVCSSALLIVCSWYFLVLFWTECARWSILQAWTWFFHVFSMFFLRKRMKSLFSVSDGRWWAGPSKSFSSAADHWVLC